MMMILIFWYMVITDDQSSSSSLWWLWQSRWWWILITVSSFLSPLVDSTSQPFCISASKVALLIFILTKIWKKSFRFFLFFLDVFFFVTDVCWVPDIWLIAPAKRIFTNPLTRSPWSSVKNLDLFSSFELDSFLNFGWMLSFIDKFPPLFRPWQWCSAVLD